MAITSRSKWRGYLVVVGGVLVHLSLGTLYTFGNISPYITSYMRWRGSAPNLTFTEATWIFACSIVGQGSCMVLGGLLQTVIGSKLTCLLGGWLMSLGVLLTYLCIKESLILTVLTYGLMVGSGTGIAYAIPLSCAMKWFPHRKGLVSGFVVAGFGGGAFIFNQVITAFVNPNNLEAESTVGDESYFDQPEVLQHVPKVFLLLGGCYASMQLIGTLLLCDPPAQEPLQSEETMVDEQETTVKEYEKRGTKAALLPLNFEKRNGQQHIKEEGLNLKPSEVLRSKYFYMLWIIFLFNGQGITFISTLYKAYGQTFIKNDSFLALVGSFSAIFNSFGRIWWGFLADKTSFRVAMMVSCASFTCLMLTFQVTAVLGRGVFFIYVCLLFGSFSGSFSLLPTATAKCFGREYLSMNYGLVFTAQVVTSPLGAFLSQQLISAIGWTGLFFLVSGFSFLSLLVAIMFRAKDRYGEEI